MNNIQTIQTAITDFNCTIDSWIAALERYDFEQLRAKPTATHWSMGQLYMHLIENLEFYLEEVQTCLRSNDHASEQKAPHGMEMFSNNCFPDEIIEGPASNADTPQPESKEYLTLAMHRLRTEMNDAAILVSKSPFNGKTKHPGLLYLNASEWIQFGDMHFRHHFRQKRRIDEFLNQHRI